MKTQFDYQKRVVSIENLKAMCDRISGTCHRFTVHTGEKSSRVIVEYSNPDEYGSPEPVRATFPAYWEKSTGLSVVLDPMRYTGHVTGKNEESWQAFFQLYDCPQLWRHDDKWETEYEILVARYPSFAVRSEWRDGGSVQVWLFDFKSFTNYREAQAFAVVEMKRHREVLARQNEQSKAS